jgi:multisubunit Na+/H+ antiporter MnhG subunit
MVVLLLQLVILGFFGSVIGLVNLDFKIFLFCLSMFLTSGFVLHLLDQKEKQKKANNNVG